MDKSVLASLSKGSMALWAIFLAGFVLRAGIVLADLPSETGDTWFYFKIADVILYGVPEPSLLFPPGYPLFIASLKFAFPDEWVPSIALWCNVLLSSGTILLTYFIARSFVTPVFSLLAAGLVAFYPNQINYVRLLLSEVSTTFLLLAGLLLAIRHRSFLAGSVLQAASLFRTTLLPVTPLLALVDVFLGKSRQRATRILAGLFTIFVIHTVAVSFDVLPRSSNLGMNLLLAIDDSRDWSLGGYTEEEKSRPLATYLSFVLDHPREYLRQRAEAVLELWGPWPSTGGDHAPRSSLRRLLIGLRFPLLLLGILGWLRNLERPEAWMLITPVFTITLIHVVFFGGPRFTYPVEPVLMILAAWGLSSYWSKAKPTTATSYSAQ